MKKLIQFFLLLLIILITFFINKTYFKTKKIEEKVFTKDENQFLSENENNLIKNLKYEIKFDNNTQYIITAELSEITYDEGVEIVKMQKVKANFIDAKEKILSIISEDAIYNNSTYNTKFINNISIDYMKNTINSKNLDLNFQNNTVSIYNDVIYEGPQGEIKADKVEIDLFSKKTVISMNNLDKKVEVIAN
tara:strand:+ start:1277 stop:1852 length:576 start_codon:yes stop_codon:yes gene_type:complete